MSEQTLALVPSGGMYHGVALTSIGILTMADIFVSYASEDRERVRGLVELLESRQWKVWWDRSLKTGEAWPDVIERELGRARCVVVVWSKAAVDSHWVRLEGHAARRRQILVPVRIDPVQPPDEFTVYQTLALDGFPSGDYEATLGEFIDAVRSQLRRTRRSKSLPWLAAFALLMLPLVGGVCWNKGACRDFLPSRWSEVKPSPPPINSIAILGFDYEGVEGDAFLAKGLADLLSSQLQIVGYLVASQIAVGALPGGADVSFIYDRLRVRWALDGTLYQSPEGVRVSAQLVDLKTGYQKDSWTFDAALADLASLQDDLTRSVIDGLDVPVLGDDRQWQISQAVGSDAYLHYLEGLDALHRENSLAEIDEAERAFENAIRAAPEFGLAHAGLCRVKLRRYVWFRSAGYFEEARTHCENALELAATDPEVSLAIGWLNYYTGAYSEAKRFFEAAMALNPSSADAYVGEANAMEALGNLSGAEANFAQATVVQPGYWKTHNEMAMFLVRHGRDDDAIARFEMALEMAPDNTTTLNNLGAAFIYADKLGLAVKTIDRSLAIAEEASTYSNLGTVYYLLNDLAGASEASRRSAALTPGDYRVRGNLADTMLLLGDRTVESEYEVALALVEEALSVNPEDAMALASASAFTAVIGDAARARESSRRAIELAPANPEVRRLVAVTNLRLGNPDAAMEEIAQAVELGYPPAMIGRDPLFESLRGRHEFVGAVGVY